MKRIRFKYLFHGTSSVCRQGIEKDGLLPFNGALHLTTDPFTALEEANWTVNGEDLRHGYKLGVGGKPIIVKVDRDAVSGLKIDRPGYYDKSSSKVRRLVAKRMAFKTERRISPASLSFIDANRHDLLKRLLDEIYEMPYRDCRSNTPQMLRPTFERNERADASLSRIHQIIPDAKPMDCNAVAQIQPPREL